MRITRTLLVKASGNGRSLLVCNQKQNKTKRKHESSPPSPSLPHSDDKNLGTINPEKDRRDLHTNQAIGWRRERADMQANCILVWKQPQLQVPGIFHFMSVNVCEASLMTWALRHKGKQRRHLEVLTQEPVLTLLSPSGT